MQKKQVLSVVKWSTIALVIPLLGQLFMEGWNWQVGDFVFAWAFFNIMGLTYTFVTGKVKNRESRIAAGVLVVLIFASIWIRLATG